MIDREKVIKGLEVCSPTGCAKEKCPYYEGPESEFWGNPDGYECEFNLRQNAIKLLKAQEPITGETSDGYHTFNELYHHRAVLFSVIVANYPDRAWKAKKHHDGTMYDGMFIVGIETPDGQATYHYDIDPYWDMFKCRVLDNAPEWDGHTPAQAIERIGRLALLKAQEPRVMTLEEVIALQEGKGDVWIEETKMPGITPWIIAATLTEKTIWQGHDALWFSDEECHYAIDYNLNTADGWRCWTSRPTDAQREATPWN